MAACNVNNQSAAIALIVISLFTIGWNEVVSFSLTTICIYDQQEIGSAAGVAGSTRSIISTIASTIYQVVLRARLAKTVPAVVGPAVVAAGLPQSSVGAYLTAEAAGTTAAFSAVPGLTASISAAGAYAHRVASAQAFSTVFLTSIAFAGCAVITSFFIPNVEDLMTYDVAATLHNRGDENTIVGAKHESKEAQLS